MNALILVDHGSKLAEANTLLEEVAARVRERGIYGAVEPAHMDLAPPTVADAFDACVAAGARDVTVALYFLGPGRHSTHDVPRLAAEAARRHPGVTWRVGPPLGVSERLVDEVLERAREAKPE